MLTTQIVQCLCCSNENARWTDGMFSYDPKGDWAIVRGPEEDSVICPKCQRASKPLPQGSRIVKEVNAFSPEKAREMRAILASLPPSSYRLP